jgi:hypothetical protein
MSQQHINSVSHASTAQLGEEKGSIIFRRMKIQPHKIEWRHSAGMGQRMDNDDDDDEDIDNEEDYDNGTQGRSAA